MELQGKVIAVLPERSGVSARGEWKAQSFVIETHEQYQRNCALMFSELIVWLSSTFRVVRNFWFLSILMLTSIRAVGSTASVPGTSSVLTLTP